MCGDLFQGLTRFIWVAFIGIYDFWSYDENFYVFFFFLIFIISFFVNIFVAGIGIS